jgi:MFS family permease
VLASAANLFQGVSFFMFIHLPRFLSDLGAGEAEIGLIFAFTALASIASRPKIGQVMDTRGRRPVILVGNVLNLGVILLYLTVNSLGPWIYAVRLVHGISQGMLFTALFTYGADIVPLERRTEGLALFGVSGLLPIAFAGALGDVVLDTWGFDQLFLTAAAAAVLAFLCSLPLPEQRPTPEASAARRGFVAAIVGVSLRPIWWITGIFALVLTGYFTFLRTFIDETGIGSVGAFFGTYASAAIMLRLLFAWLPARVGERRVLYPALGSTAVGFVVLATASAGWQIALAGLFCGMGHAYVFPILFALTVTRSEDADRGSSLAFFTALFDLGTLVGGPLLGLVIAAAGYPSMYMLAAVLTVVGAAIFAAWDARATDEPRQTAMVKSPG